MATKAATLCNHSPETPPPYANSHEQVSFIKTHETAMKILGVLGLIAGAALVAGGGTFLGAFYLHTVVPICAVGLLTALITLVGLSALSAVIKPDSSLQETLTRAKAAAFAGAVTFGLGISPLGPIALGAAPGIALIYYSLEMLKSAS